MLLKAFKKCIGFDLESSLLGTRPVEIIGQGTTHICARKDVAVTALCE